MGETGMLLGTKSRFVVAALVAVFGSANLCSSASTLNKNRALGEAVKAARELRAAMLKKAGDPVIVDDAGDPVACAICRDDITQSTCISCKGRATTGHLFHHQCLVEWLSSRPAEDRQCPLGHAITKQALKAIMPPTSLRQRLATLLQDIRDMSASLTTNDYDSAAVRLDPF